MRIDDRYNDIRYYGPDAPPRLEISVTEWMTVLQGGTVQIDGKTISYDDGPFMIVPDDASLEKGGEGSGHRHHRGRPRLRGGSLPGEGDPMAGLPHDAKTRMKKAKNKLDRMRRKTMKMYQTFKPQYDALVQQEKTAQDAYDESVKAHLRAWTDKRQREREIYLDVRGEIAQSQSGSKLEAVDWSQIEQMEAERYATDAPYQEIMKRVEETDALRKKHGQEIDDAKAAKGNLLYMRKIAWRKMYREEFGITGDRYVQISTVPGTDPAHEIGLLSTDSKFDAVNRDFQSMAEGASMFYEGMLGENVPFPPVHYGGTRRDRGYYRQEEQTAYLNKFHDIPTYVHEFGHHLEESTNAIRMLAKTYLASRAKGKVLAALQEVGQWYRPDEEYYRGAFKTRPYAGKHYSDGATEVISMGMQMLYEDPFDFAATDSNYFRFMVGVASGTLLTEEGD